MKAAYGARAVFGASAILFGVIALLWHDVATWQDLSRLWRMPGGLAIGEILLAAFIVGGVLLFIPRLMHCGAIVLAIVCALFPLTCVPAILKIPGVYQTWGSFFEWFSMVCGPLALLGLARPSRIVLGLCSVSFAVEQIVYLNATASFVPSLIPPNPMFWAIFTTICFALAAIALLVDVRARLAAQLLALMVVLFGIIIWIPRVVLHPGDHNNWSEFAINFLVAGSASLVAAYAFGNDAGTRRRGGGRSLV